MKNGAAARGVGGGAGLDAPLLRGYYQTRRARTIW